MSPRPLLPPAIVVAISCYAIARYGAALFATVTVAAMASLAAVALARMMLCVRRLAITPGMLAFAIRRLPVVTS